MEFMSFGSGSQYSAYGGAGGGGAGGAPAAAGGWGGPNAGGGGLGMGSSSGGGGWGAAFGGGGGTPDFTGGPELDEPPLLEELGIDPGQIVRRTVAMLNPMGRADDNAGDDDLAGPLLFAFLMGALHLLRGRVHFGYILGWFTLSTMAMYWLLNQLAVHGEGIELYRTGSVVGYCMLPMCLLAALSIVLPGGLFTGIIAGVLVMWCTSKSTAQFTRSLPQSSEGKKLVVAYPCFTLYCLFALLSVF